MSEQVIDCEVVEVVGYASKIEALRAAEDAGFSYDVVRTTYDAGTRRHDWHVKEIAGLGAAVWVEMPDPTLTGAEVGLVAAVADASGLAPDGALAAVDVVADVISGLLTWDGDVGDADVELPDVVGTDVDEPELVDIDVSVGFGGLVGGFGFDREMEVETAASAGDVAEPEVLAIGGLRRVVLQVNGEMPEAAARLFAEMMAGRFGCLLTVRDAETFEVIDHIVGEPGARRVAPITGGNGGGRRVPVERAAQVRAERDWLTYDAREVCKGGNVSNIKVWQSITDAAEKLDLDALRSFSFAGSADDTTGNTYTKNNGRYLRAQIARVEGVISAREAALAAEFGY